MKIKACIDLVMNLASIYHDYPLTILPFILKPLWAKKGPIPPRQIKARLDILHTFLVLYGVEDDQFETQHGLKAQVYIYV